VFFRNFHRRRHLATPFFLAVTFLAGYSRAWKIEAQGAVKRAFAIRVEAASAVDMRDPKVRAVLFGQRAG
jgi:hypothetical protein